MNRELVIDKVRPISSMISSGSAFAAGFPAGMKQLICAAPTGAGRCRW